MTKVRRKEFKKRSLASVDFQIWAPELSVKMYSIVQQTKKGSYTWMSSRTNHPLRTMTKYINQESGERLRDSQIKLQAVFGGEPLIFTKDEVEQIKRVDEHVGLKLIGFKPRSCLKVYHNVSHSSFLYPDDKKISGSGVMFCALLDRMIARNRIAIARFTPRKNSAVKFVALLPQLETFDAKGVQTNPSGLHVIYLPFADDIRALRLEQRETAPNSLIEKAKAVVKSLRIRFDSKSFENPALQRHFSSLQALALDRDEIEPTPDYIAPDVDGMMKFEELILDFKDTAFPSTYEQTLGTKRKANLDENGNPYPKRPKFECTVDAQVVEDLLNAGNLQLLLVKQLKDFMAANAISVPSGARKDDLLKIIENFVRS
eukprot:TRINITY_DN1838_c0_g1_i2.p1 TRINITY_DN1838_c0_g1~~TRINITY_DN1838_c0_g1_i2.p1  ORF type:complete len:373 (-),score=69.32 TRINITY_DN1838_c0_g1_i2:73-1191(-)